MKPNPAESKEDALRLATLVTHFQSNCMHEALGSVVNSIWEPCIHHVAAVRSMGNERGLSSKRFSPKHVGQLDECNLHPCPAYCDYHLVAKSSSFFPRNVCVAYSQIARYKELHW